MLIGVGKFFGRNFRPAKTILTFSAKTAPLDLKNRAGRC
jgi:hypothetical protein